MIYSEIIEKAIQGVLRVRPEASRARLTMQADAAFSQINDEVSITFAANEDKRALLRKNVALVFVSGSIGIPAGVLKDYLKDATLQLSTGEVASLIEPYADFLRVRDNRLPWWSYSNSLMSAINSATYGSGVYSGAATLTCIASPDIPVLAADTFTGPDEFTVKLINALTEYLTGKPEDDAATNA